MSGRFLALQIDGGEVESEEDEVAEGETRDFLVLHEDQDGVILEDEDDDDEEDSDYEEDEYDDVNDDDPSTASLDAVIGQVLYNAVEDGEDCVRRKGGGKAAASSSSQGNGKGGAGENDRGGEWSRSEIDGSFCPICMEAWTNGDDHQVCCLPCGHLYGASCIRRWLRQCRNSGKCPQCNMKCTLKDVRVIYALQIVAIDQELPKKVLSLEAKCASFEKKDGDWHKKEVEWRRREADLHLQVQQLTERTSYLERLLGDTPNKSSRLFNVRDSYEENAIFGHNVDLEFSAQGSSDNFILQKEFLVDGAKIFDVDASNEIIIVARRLSGMGGMHSLTKISLIAPHERENIQLPVNTKAVKDLRISPHCSLALVASLGKKLSVISTESNNTVLSYDLPAAAWSCSWDLGNSHYVYTGLQNGMLMVFDMRQTSRPMEFMNGLTCNLIHSMHSLSPDLTLPCGVRSLLTASSVGICHWSLGGGEVRPFLVPESENQGVCIALAYCPSSNHIVASFRPKVEVSGEMAVTQPSLTPATTLFRQAVQGSHVLYKSVGSRCYQKLGSTCANVNDIRLPKSAIIHRENHNLQFASDDELTCELVLQELPSFMAVQHFKPWKHPIRDMKYTHELSSGLLSCLSEDILQLFSNKTL